MAQIQSVLFVYLLIGILCRKTGLVAGSARQSFTNFLLYVSLPCMVFQSFDMEFTWQTMKQGALAFVIALATAMAALVFGKIAYRRVPADQRCIMEYGTLVNNAGFVGLPVVESAYGQAGLFLGSLFIIPNRIMMWSAGISLFTDAPLKQRVKSVLLNPGIIAVWLGFARMMFRPALPSFAVRAVSALGAMSGPLSMIVIGMILSDIDVRSLLEPKAFVLVAVRQFLFPLAALAVLRLLGADALTTNIAVVITGMPIGSSTAILADKYGANAAFASKCVFVSTVTSLVTIPILTLFL